MGGSPLSASLTASANLLVGRLVTRDAAANVRLLRSFALDAARREIDPYARLP